MQDIENEFLSAFKQLIQHYEELLNILQEEYFSIIQLNLEKLQIAAIEKQAKIKSIFNSENYRKKIVKDLSVVLGLSYEEIRISQLLFFFEKKNSNYSEILNIYYQNLLSITKKVLELNSKNKALVLIALKKIDTMRKNIFSKESADSDIYTSYGVKLRNENSSLFLFKEA